MIHTTAPPVTTAPPYFPDELRAHIETARDEAETLRRLPPWLAEELRAAGAFRLLTPTEQGGAECSLTELFDVLEAAGRIDGSTAWVVWNGNIGFAAALLEPDAVERIWPAGADPIIVNSARPAGGLVAQGDHFELSGRWDIVTGIDCSDWVTLFAFVMDGAGPLMRDDGPDMRVCFVPRRDVEIVDTWHTTGMRGTGSNTAVVDGVRVDANLAISPFTPSRIDRPTYRIPAFTLALTGSAPIVIGMTQNVIDAVVALAPTKITDNGEPLARRPHAQAQLGAAQAALDAAHALTRQTVGEIDAAARAGDPVDVLLRARLRAAMSHTGVVCREVLATCRLLASSSAIYLDRPLERLLRDAEVALQHLAPVAGACGDPRTPEPRARRRDTRRVSPRRRGPAAEPVLVPGPRRDTMDRCPSVRRSAPKHPTTSTASPRSSRARSDRRSSPGSSPPSGHRTGSCRR